MMEEERSSRTVWIVLAVIIGALLLCTVSALAGGAIGYYTGQRAAERNMPMRQFEYEGPMPRMPQTPEMPQMPEIPQRIEPFAGQSLGALITQIEPKSPADLAGLQLGDVILAVDGQTLSEETDLRDLLLGYQPGDSVALMILRGADRRTLSVELGQAPDRPGKTAYLGVVYRTIPMGTQPRRQD